MTGEFAAPVTVVETRLGHVFHDRDLLLQALTHVSFLAPEKARTGSYQRLEFLGDHVLGLVVSDMLYRAFPQAEEGELSRRLAGLVRRETCAEVAAEWGVGQALRLGPGEAAGDGRNKPAILANVCESLIGAVFVEAGYAVAATIVERDWGQRMLQPSLPLRDPKTALQEWAQGRGKSIPAYHEASRSGPHHAPVFTVSVDVEGCPSLSGTGSSKRRAEQAAAEAFLRREGVLDPQAISAKASA